MQPPTEPRRRLRPVHHAYPIERPRYATPVPSYSVKMPCVACHHPYREETLASDGRCGRCRRAGRTA